MFGKPKSGDGFLRVLVGEWHADTSSGDVTSSITAEFTADGAFQTHNVMEIRGVAKPMATQVGRFRIEAVDKQRFRLLTIDENGAPLSATVRTFIDRDTMVNEVGRITFHRVRPSESEPTPEA